LLSLHNVNVVHWDIKPDNFLVRKLSDKTMRVVLSDFGLSTSPNTRLMVDRRWTGTTSYKAPENVTNTYTGDGIAKETYKGVDKHWTHTSTHTYSHTNTKTHTRTRTHAPTITIGSRRVRVRYCDLGNGVPSFMVHSIERYLQNWRAQ
jgi:serine/threonine protein kinase